MAFMQNFALVSPPFLTKQLFHETISPNILAKIETATSSKSSQPNQNKQEVRGRQTQAST